MATATEEGKDTRHLSAVDGDDAALAAQMRPESDEPLDAASRADERGRSIESMAEDEPEERVPPTQLAIPGTRDRILTSFGGKQPTDSELRIMGGKRPIIGSFDKGETITVLSTGIIRAVEGSDTDDEWGTVSKTTRIHKMRQLQVQVATPEVLARALLAALSLDEAKVLLQEIAGA